MVRATAPEQDWLIRLMLGEVRIGALDGLMVEAVAAAAGMPVAAVRRAVMLSGSLGRTAYLALTGTLADVEAVGLTVGTPVLPMLASTAHRRGRGARPDRAGVGRVQARRRARAGPPGGRAGRATCGCSRGPWPRSPTGSPRWSRSFAASPAHEAHPRRGDALPRRGRAPAAVPGDDEPVRREPGREGASARGAAAPVVLRRAARRRRATCSTSRCRDDGPCCGRSWGPIAMPGIETRRSGGRRASWREAHWPPVTRGSW